MATAMGRAMMELGEMDLVDPNPDIYALFLHYNWLYFDDALGACTTVSWSSPRMTRCAGICRYQTGGGCEIRLSEPLLKFRSTADLKNTLLHEMIHAYLWIKNKNKDHSDHGPSFQAMMRAINCSSSNDHQKPAGGYNVTIFHDFREEFDSYRVHQWSCNGCGDLIKRAINREPSVSDCMEHVGSIGRCSHPSCHWHKHKALCSGSYIKIAEPSGYKDKRRRSKVKEELPVKEEFHKSRSDGPLHRTQISHEGEEATKPGYQTITNFFPSASGLKNLGSSYPCEAMQPTDIESPVLAPKIPQRRRSPVFRKKRNYPLAKRRKVTKRKDNCPVIIQWLDYYAYEETDEEIEPLINKRTERRKMARILKEKMLRDRTDIKPMIEVMNSSYGTDTTEAYLSCAMLDMSTKQEYGGIKSDAKDCVVAEAVDYYARRQPAFKHQALQHFCSREVKTEGCVNQVAFGSKSVDKDDIIYISDG